MAADAEKCAKAFERVAEMHRRSEPISYDEATELLKLIGRNGYWIAEAIRECKYAR